MADAYSSNPFTQPFDPAFKFEKALLFPRSNAPNADPHSEHVGYAMVKSGPPVPQEECELVDVSAVEIVILWGTTVLHVAHLNPPRVFAIGEDASRALPLDFVLPADKLGAGYWSLIEIENGAPNLVVPVGAAVRVLDAHPTSKEHIGALLAAGPAARRSLPLTHGCSVEMKLGELVLRVAAVNAGKPAKRSLLALADRSSFAWLGLTALAHAAILGSLAFFTPSLGLTDDEGIDQDRLYAIQQYLDAAAERERRAIDESTTSDAPGEASNAVSEAAQGAQGKMGKLSAAVANHRTGVKGPIDNPDPHLAREQALREAEKFGLIGMLTSMNAGSNTLTVPWGRDTSLGTDPMDALGNMWGPDIGEAAGSGGLSVSGTEQGGGGFSDQIGLDRVGTCQGAFCGGLKGGFGSSFGRKGPEHAPSAPRMRPLGTTVVGGRLPPEVIQRVVRQNFGRFRQCYENGLRSNPNLEGRVAVRFVIGREGAVSNAANGGSDLPDSGVVSCVVSAYYGLSFPPPEDGVVSVVYPIMFQPGS